MNIGEVVKEHILERCSTGGKRWGEGGGGAWGSRWGAAAAAKRLAKPGRGQRLWGIRSGRSDEWEHNQKGPTDRKNPSDLLVLRQRMGTGAGAARFGGACGEGYPMGNGQSTPPAL